MPLDPHAKKLLEMLNAAGAADMARMAPQQMRADFERLAAMVGENGVAVDAAEDRALAGPGGAIPIRVYAPQRSGAATRRGFVFLPRGGGGFLGHRGAPVFFPRGGGERQRLPDRVGRLPPRP